MVFSIFRPPGDGETVAECRLGDICDATDFSYEAYFCGVGTFELKMPITSAFAGILQPNVLLYTPRFGGFIIKNILRTESEVKLTGYDLNGILRDRLILTADDTPDGKDEVSGSTEYCVKYYVAKNLISAVDNNRNIPRLETAEDSGRGLPNDHYLASPENLDDVVRTMCENAKLGYRISMNVNSGGSAPVFVFDVAERFDAQQGGGQRPAFSIGLGNISALTREVGVTAEKNALWCDTGGANQFVFKEEPPPVSWERREDFVSLSLVNKDDGEEIMGTARQVMADKYAQTDSLTVTAGNIREYGKSYKLGDLVTVYDKRNRAQLESWISGAEIKLTATEESVKLILGSAKPKVLDGLAKKSDLLKKSQSDFPPAEAKSALTLTEYEYLTDLSVKYNGVTYTAEKDDTTGLISRIYDDSGNEFEPTINSGITDITMHNAAFLAVAMCRGLNRSPNIIQLYNAGNECTDITGGWSFVTANRSWETKSGVSYEKRSDSAYGELAKIASGERCLMFRTNNKVNISNYTLLHAEGRFYANYSNSNGINGRLMFGGGASINSDNTTAMTFDNSLSGSEVVTILTKEISSVYANQEFYINFTLYDGAEYTSEAAYFEITRVWLEK